MNKRNKVLLSVVTSTDVIKMYPHIKRRTIFNRLKRVDGRGEKPRIFHIDSIIEEFGIPSWKPTNK